MKQLPFINGWEASLMDVLEADDFTEKIKIYLSVVSVIHTLFLRLAVNNTSKVCVNAYTDFRVNNHDLIVVMISSYFIIFHTALVESR